MVQVKFQEATVVAQGDSRFNKGEFDTVNVHTTIKTNGKLEEPYYVPGGASLSKASAELVRQAGLEFRPYRESDLLAGTDNIEEAAKEGKTPETVEDAAKLILRSTLVKKELTEVAVNGSEHVYTMEYSYKLFPDFNNKDQFAFEIRLPFDGGEMGNGSEVDLTVMTPFKTTLNKDLTKGQADNGQTIEESVQNLPKVQRDVITFDYRVDPLFKVVYAHNEPANG